MIQSMIREGTISRSENQTITTNHVRLNTIRQLWAEKHSDPDTHRVTSTFMERAHGACARSVRTERVHAGDEEVEP